MDLTQLTIADLTNLLTEKEDLRITVTRFVDEIRRELAKRQKFEDLKSQFSGLSAEEFEAVRNSLFLSPNSIETDEKTKI